tara:strand:+ start:1126 stop:1302 length:177 start_codon:yes stop_codon:yes gene_type:complete
MGFFLTRGLTMNCWHCNEELIWGGDHDADEEGFAIITNLHCPACNTLVFVYLPVEEAT